MAASYETKLEIPFSGSQLDDYLGEIAQTLAKSEGWKIVQQTQNSITLTVGLNFLSWGEMVTIQANNSSLSIRSECRFPLQIFDWWKNRANTDVVCEVIKQSLPVSA